MAEYAKSNRAGCRKCKSKIGQGSLRIALMEQSRFHDGKIPRWHHYSCLFKGRKLPRSSAEVGGRRRGRGRGR